MREKPGIGVLGRLNETADKHQPREEGLRYQSGTNPQSHCTQVVIIHSAHEDSLCPPPISPRNDVTRTHICLQGGRSLVSAMLSSCKVGDHSCPLPHTCGSSPGTQPSPSHAGSSSLPFLLLLPSSGTFALRRATPCPAGP